MFNIYIMQMLVNDYSFIESYTKVNPKFLKFRLM